MERSLRPPQIAAQGDAPNRSQWAALVRWRPAWEGCPPRLTPLTPEASARRYLRATDPEGSLILQLHPGPLSAADPFLRLQGWLAARGWPVVEVVASLPEVGVVVLEDLGDRHLSPQGGGAGYGVAVDLVADLHRLDPAGAPLAPPFDAALFLAEVRLFLDAFATLTGWRDTTRAEEILAPVCDALARLPRVICHRDYHRRNLMVVGDGLRILDFQDARLGPRAYDLASLLEDPYATLPEATREALRARYAARAGVAPEGYALAACQRLVKAAGTYCQQQVARANPAYLPHVAPALARAARAATELTAGHPRLAPLLADLGAAWERRR